MENLKLQLQQACMTPASPNDRDWALNRPLMELQSTTINGHGNDNNATPGKDLLTSTSVAIAALRVDETPAAPSVDTTSSNVAAGATTHNSNANATTTEALQVSLARVSELEKELQITQEKLQASLIQAEKVPLLETQIQEFTVSRSEYESTLTTMKSELQSTEQKYVELLNTHTIALQAVNSDHDKIAYLESQVNSLVSENELSAQHISDLEVKLQKSQQLVTDMELANGPLRVRVDELTTQLNVMEPVLLETQQALAAAKSKSSQLESTVQSIESTLATQQQDLHSAQAQLSEKDSRIEALQVQVKDLTTTIEASATSAAANSSAEQLQLQNLVAENTTLLQNWEESKKALMECESALQTATIEKEESIKQSLANKLELENLQQENDQLKTQVVAILKDLVSYQFNIYINIIINN